MKTQRFWLIPLLVVVSPLLMAAPESRYWGFWDKHNPSSSATIDHSDWQTLLSSYLTEVSEGTYFSYSMVSPEDRQVLKSYLDGLKGLDPRTYNRNEQLAYWINFYNALTVDLILDNYPVKSITKLGPWYRFGPWDDTVTKVAGQPLTLNDIEHRILRPIWKDKRIHYVVNCASKGCPDLMAEPFTAENVNEKMEAAAKRFIQQEKGVSFVDGKLTLSRVYEWYADDFGSKESLLRHLKQHSTPAMIRKIDEVQSEPLYQYNWSLNQP